MWPLETTQSMAGSEDMNLDLTDWATLLEVLDGARAPFAPLSSLPTSRPCVPEPPKTANRPDCRRHRRITWQLVP
jgi:hypothetical protein